MARTASKRSILVGGLQIGAPLRECLAQVIGLLRLDRDGRGQHRYEGEKQKAHPDSRLYIRPGLGIPENPRSRQDSRQVSGRLIPLALKRAWRGPAAEQDHVMLAPLPLHGAWQPARDCRVADGSSVSYGGSPVLRNSMVEFAVKRLYAEYSIVILTRWLPEGKGRMSSPTVRTGNQYSPSIGS